MATPATPIHSPSPPSPAALLPQNSPPPPSHTTGPVDLLAPVSASDAPQNVTLNLKRAPAPSLGDEYTHDDNDAGDRRIQRWLEQQCRFAGVDEEVVVDAEEWVGEEESTGNGAAPSLTSSTPGVPEAATAEEDRADSPLLGFGALSPQDEAEDPLCRPARDYVRSLPVGDELNPNQSLDNNNPPPELTPTPTPPTARLSTISISTCLSTTSTPESSFTVPSAASVPLGTPAAEASFPLSVSLSRLSQLSFPLPPSPNQVSYSTGSAASSATQGKLEHEKTEKEKKHSPAPSYSSSSNSSSHARSHSRSHSQTHRKSKRTSYLPLGPGSPPNPYRSSATPNPNPNSPASISMAFVQPPKRKSSLVYLAGTGLSRRPSEALRTRTEEEDGEQPPTMYHLPTAMQHVRRSTSQLQLLSLAQSGSVPLASVSALPGTLSPLSTGSLPVMTTTTPSPLTPSPTPTPTTGVTGTLHPVSTPTPTSPLPPSAPPTRRQSRAASVSVSVALPVGHGPSPSISSVHSQAHGMSMSTSRSRSRAGSITLNTLAVMPHHSMGSPSRHAVYIDSEEVRERLDELLARAGSDDGILELEREFLAEGGEEGLEEEGEGLEYEERLEEDAYHTTFALGGGITPPTRMTQPQPPLAQGHPPARRQRQQERRPSLALNLNLGPPPNTPSYLDLDSFSVVPTTPNPGSSNNNNATTTTTIYKNQHASSSQVYIGPSPSPPHTGEHSRDTSLSTSNSGSGGSHNSRVHSRTTSTSYSQQARSQSGTQGHSRAPSLETPSRMSSTRALSRAGSRSQSQSQSPAERTHSRAASKERQRAEMAEQVPLPQPMQMIIPVPLRLPPLPTTSRKPTRPPPAPPLNLGLEGVEAVGGDGALGGGREEEELMLDADELLDLSVEVEVEERMMFARDVDVDADDQLGLQLGLLEEGGGGGGVDVDYASVEGMAIGDEDSLGRGAEEDGEFEEEEMTPEDIERMQFLRGLKLEDRMHMPAELVEFPRASLASVESGVDEGGHGHSPERDVHFTAAPPTHPAMMRSMSRWSLTSSTVDESPVVADPGAAGKEKEKELKEKEKELKEKEKEKERKRKSFVSFGDKEKESGSLSPGLAEKDAGGAGKEKKRGRLASFISRLSGVGGPGTPFASSSYASSSTLTVPDDVPPVPLLPSPQIVDASSSSSIKRKEKEKEGLPPLPADATPPPQASSTSRDVLPLDFMQTQSQMHEKPTPTYTEEGEFQVAGAVRGVWDASPTSAGPSNPSGKSTTKAKTTTTSKSAPGSPVLRARAALPTFTYAPPLPIQAKLATTPLAKSASDGLVGGSTFRMSGRNRSNSVADSLQRGVSSPNVSFPTSVSAYNNNSSSSSSSALSRRPALVKSASASLLRPGQGVRMSTRGVPTAMHLQTYPYHAPVNAVAVDGSVPPTPTSLASTEECGDEEEEEDQEEEDEEDYGIVRERGAGVGVVDKAEREKEKELKDKEEEGDVEMERGRREKAHEDRWTRARMEADAEGKQLPEQPQEVVVSPTATVIGPSSTSTSGSSSTRVVTAQAAKVESALMALAPPTAGLHLQASNKAQAPVPLSLPHQQGQEQHPRQQVQQLPPPQQQQQPQPESPLPLLQRPRLKSMTSLGNLVSSSSTTPLPHTPNSPNSLNTPNAGKSSTSKGFRGFVERMGLVGSSNGSGNNNNTPYSQSQSQSQPGTPLSMSVSMPGSASGSTTAFSSLNPDPDNNMEPSLVSGLLGKVVGGTIGKGAKAKAKGPKRKLVISGVGLEDVKGYEAVRRWCESFGEVREMTRAPNGSLYVDFRKASVAETVCRLQAQVYIKGAGSVSVSWYTKKNMPTM